MITDHLVAADIVIGEKTALPVVKGPNGAKKNKYIYYIHMLLPGWIFQPEPFQLAQISLAEWIQG